MSPKKYIMERMATNYMSMFGEKPKTQCKSLLEKGNHPETDTSDPLDAKGIQQYQSMILRDTPRVGHLEHLKRICGYLVNTLDYKIWFHTHQPDYSDVHVKIQEWYQLYGEVSELLPSDAPEPLGKFVTLTYYVDANLMHDVITGHSMMACLHFVNATPIDWYSKKQATIETAAYGSEFVVACTCVEQVIDLQTALRYLGVNVHFKSYMFGDNESMVNSSAQLYAKLTKQHNMLSFHHICEAIASGYVTFVYLSGKCNPSYILSKHWASDEVQ